MKLLASQYAMLLLLASFLSNGCSGHRDNPPLSGISISPSPTATAVNNADTRQNVSAIRAIDFGNFEYPLAKNVRITLRNGKYEGNAQEEDFPISLSHLAYGDVTRDGSEDALVVLFENVRGSAIPYHVFVYSIVDGSPKLLWSFETGDRADGGLRQVYAESGDLTIELYGKGTSIGGKLYNTEEAACCPRFVSRTRYQWSQNRFSQIGDVAVSANPSTGAGVVMSRYQATN